jgi:hypothetical protein
MTRRARLASALGATLLAGTGLAGCASDRNFVVTDASQVGDLYTRGELTDHKGNRWDVTILPGVVPPFEHARAAFVESREIVSDLGEGDFWVKRGDDVTDGVRFAGKTCLADFMKDGIAEDYSLASAAIAANARETPIGWIPRIVGNAVWGYVVKPAGRVVLAGAGAACGLGYSAVAPTAQVLARPVGGAGCAVGGGVVLPAGLLAWQQPAYLFALMNREPDVASDGSFGLRIKSRAAAPTPPRDATVLTLDQAQPAIERALGVVPLPPPAAPGPAR